MAKVLIVDDEPNMRFLLRTVLELAGHAVAEAPNGMVAVQQVEGGEIPDLVATDFMMPVMNGGELIARLRRNPATQGIPVILISSSPGSERQTTANVFLKKPFDPAVLVSCTAKLLEEKG